ncbi:MAG: SAM-dependent methyltransferase [Pseudonocardiaceae bacterium]
MTTEVDDGEQQRPVDRIELDDEEDYSRTVTPRTQRAAERDALVTEGSPTPGRKQPPDIDTSVSHSARVWNYWLGGKDNYPADREAGEQILAFAPGWAVTARAVRGFLVRAVQHLAGEVGIRQFLDIGTGLPTANNTHEAAQVTAPQCRIVYVDNDPLVLAHARALLTSSPQGVTDYIDADLRDTGTIVREAARTLDFTQPIALMLLGIINHILDNDEAYAIVNRLLDALPAGSYLVLSHPTTEVDREAMEESVRLWNERGTPLITFRSRQELLRFFDRLELLEPGVVSCSRWRPDPSDLGAPADVYEFGGVGRKP